MNDLSVPEAKAMGGNPRSANWAAAFAKMSKNGVLGGATPENPDVGATAEYNPSGVAKLGSETIGRIADATRCIAARINGIEDDPPQLVRATGQIIEINSAQKSPNGVEKMDKIPTTAFDTIDRLAQQIDSELFVDVDDTLENVIQRQISELEGIYTDFTKLSLEEVKPLFQDSEYCMIGSVKCRIQDDILPRIDKLVENIENTDYGACGGCNITKDDIMARIAQLQDRAETILDTVINKEAEIEQQRKLNSIANGDTSCVCAVC